MKKQFTYLFMAACAFCLVLSTPLQAQESGSSITVIKTVTHEDGTVTTVKKRLSGDEDPEAYLETLTEDEGAVSVDIQVVMGEEPSGEADDEPVLFFRRANSDDENEEIEEVRIFMNGDAGDFTKVIEERIRGPHPNSRTKKVKAVKAFLGIYPGSTDDNAGVAVRGVVDGTGAQAGGIQKGDVIQSIAGYATNGNYGLSGVLQKLEPGQQVEVQVLRDGQPQTLSVVLGEKEYMRTVLNEDREPCDVFIGVYVGGTGANGEGVQVTNIIGGTPAEEYGVQPGDVILAMDGVKVKGNAELLKERNKHEPGDEFMLTINRGGMIKDLGAKFYLCERVEEEAPAIVEEAMDIPESTLELVNYRAFPNPSYGLIRVQFAAEEAPVSVQVTDVSGRVVYQQQLNQFDGYFDEEIDLSGATPGNLFLTIQQDGKLTTKQLLLINRV
ncbi:PDZ domain-containing protein [Phaeodactylibacter xiamenensis]|uniref:PDZ domain-containing protein n=1 Tax=Phaeodactylibacter xiamenensis TaxID=1524460 RepID=UPI003CCC1ABD